MPDGERSVDFDVFDADNHYYEATDAFTRHLAGAPPKRVQWAEIDGKQRMIVDGKIIRFIPNPTFDPVARPGCLDDYFRGKQAGDDIRAAFGELEPISPAYREPDGARRSSWTRRASRAASCSRRSVSAWRRRCCTTPTRCTTCSTRSTSGCSTTGPSTTDDRIFAAPYITLQDPTRAEHEVDVRARATARTSS